MPNSLNLGRAAVSRKEPCLRRGGSINSYLISRPPHLNLVAAMAHVKHSSKASAIRSLVLDGGYRPSEIAVIAKTSRPYVSRISSKMRAPKSRYARMDAHLQALRHEVARLRGRVEEIARLQVK